MWDIPPVFQGLPRTLQYRNMAPRNDCHKCSNLDNVCFDANVNIRLPQTVEPLYFVSENYKFSPNKSMHNITCTSDMLKIQGHLGSSMYLQIYAHPFCIYIYVHIQIYIYIYIFVQAFTCSLQLHAYALYEYIYKHLYKEGDSKYGHIYICIQIQTLIKNRILTPNTWRFP